MAELATLIRKRGTLKTRLTFFKNFLQRKIEANNFDSASLMELQERMQRFSDVITEFDNIQGQIEEISDEETHILERDEFEALFFQQIGLAKSLLESNNDALSHHSASSHASASQTSNGSSKSISIKLPTINLPSFDGNISNFQEFYDTFVSIIHNNESLNAIQKFHYLRSAVKGEAASMIQSIKMSSANYQVAWDLLCERFKNKPLLIHNHLKAIFNLPVMQRENYGQMREIIDGLAKNIRSLQVLELDETQLFESLIIFIISQKLDVKTVRDWETVKSNKDDLPTLNEFEQFLKDKSSILEVINHKSLGTDQQSSKGRRSNCMVANSTSMSCFHCKGNHSLYDCEVFKKLSTADRVESMRSKKRCLNCLRLGHFADKCLSRGCKLCKAKHHTFLHEHKVVKSEGQETTKDSNENSQMSMCTSSSMNILLATALVKVKDANGREHSCRALLDSGSQSNLVSAKFVKRLSIPTNKVKISLTGVGQVRQSVESSCFLNVESGHSKFKESISCLVVENVCGIVPSYPVSNIDLGIPYDLPLADPSFHQPGEVDILLGAQWFFKIMCIGRINLNEEGLVVQRTRLGWVISGPVSHEKQFGSSCNLSLTQSPIDVQAQLEKFWTIESCESSKELIPECEEHFRNTTSRMEDGRFMVSVPLKEPYETLGESFVSAKKRFIALEHKLERNPTLKGQYNSFMKEYEDMGHMTEDTSNQVAGYYIPHHGVCNEQSATTKLRVVFDASMVTSTGKSLNHIQLVGHTIQNDLFTILLRFRRHAYALCADVQKMYRQVLVNPNDRTYQKILWRPDAGQPLKTFVLNTVTYGTAAAPFLATRALHEMGISCKMEQPKVSEVIQNDFYVDDMLSGADTIPDAIKLAKEVSQTLAKGCFPLRKWRSNSTEIMQALVEGNSSSDPHEISSKEDAKTLGLIWNQNSDEFIYRTDIIQAPESATKRSVLSTIARMFDPPGFLGPITIIAKIILQQVWLDKLAWDEILPPKTFSLWQSFCRNFAILSEIKVPRYLLCNHYTSLHLHGFSDSSEKAYGACIYVVSVSPDKTISILLCAKSRVAPLKVVSIPRLELCAAHLLAQLVDRIVKELDLVFTTLNLWSDSSIVLAWLKTPPLSLKTFVRNRVAEIQDLTKTARWRHVRTNENPADLLSRGTTPQQLKDNSLWWHGPEWLRLPEPHWPRQKNEELNLQSIPELKLNLKTLVSIRVNLPIDIFRFSSLTRLQRTFAYSLRFLENCKPHSERRKGSLTVKELHNSLMIIIRFVQGECFTRDIDSLKRRGIVESKSPILNLNPFLDDEQILRVGGRLNLSDFPYDKKFPILLPKGHHLTKLIFSYEHIRLGHAGPELLLSSIRDHYWPVCGRNTAKETFRKCVKCFRVNPRSDMPIMGNLPAARFQQSHPFANTGMDYAGPILIKNKNGRGYKLTKAYICIFVCLTTRAIHLEVATDLSTETFLAAFRRFISRRGRPTSVYSDNGTNFVGARRELDEVGQFLMKHQSQICDATSTDGVTFHFIPPKSPHFGGMWEAGVKSTKTILKKIIANAHLTYEGIYTTLTQIEAILNSRPLSPLSSNPTDLEPLTPAHFLIGRKLTALPEYNFESSPISRLSMFERAQQLAQHFWRRWSREYIAQLQQRQKWKTTSPNIQKDTLVLIREDNIPPIKWKLGRVIDLHPGKDGVVRVVSIKCSDSVTKRPCAKICPLPLN